ncbi:MAG TPA: hypothetical protein VM939_08945 [Gemmatimonadaceae bacterium]|nr:hypothetical protein [Gemmatimonadaceae bacterium]
MRRVAVQLFSLSLQLLPLKFRLRYASEMQDVFLERGRDRSGLALLIFTADEVSGLVATALRARFDPSVLPKSAIAGVIMATALTLVVMRSFPVSTTTSSAVNRMDVSAHDPAGEFTVTIREGKAVAATIDRVPLPRHQIVHRGDSIRIMSRGGEVVLALAYHRDKGQIEWKARSASCRLRAAECVSP